MQLYDLIAFDIDGTLLDSRNRISPTIYPLLRAVEERGVGVTLVSGRPDRTVGLLMKDLDLTLPHISSGGAQITAGADGADIASFRLDPATVRKLADLGREFGVGLITMEKHGLSYEGHAGQGQTRFVHETVDIQLRNGELLKTQITPVDDIVEASPHPLKFTLSAPPDRLRLVEERLRASELPVYSTYSLPIYLESTNQQTNKGTALHLLAYHLRIPLERVLVVGDSPNDISMFHVAGAAIAMDNATAEVKAAARLVAPSNDEDGVAWVLREIVLANRPI